MLLLTVVACKAVDPAPAELDALLHYLWQRYDDEADDALAEAVVNLDAAVGGDVLAEPFDGAVTRLSEEEAAAVGVTDRDPGLAPGVYLVNAFDCPFDQLEEILSYGAQDELYEGVYDTYSRTFDADRDAWLGQPGGWLTYRIDYSASLLGASYSASSDGALRRIADQGNDLTPFGRSIAQRVVMPRPADFEGDGKSLDQDYQLELYWPRGEGRVVHAYGLWRQADYGAGIDMEDEGTQRILLNNLLDWDDNTAALCAEGRP